MVEEEITVVFPFVVLGRNGNLVDPANTQTTFEYYLLENIAVGLVRDSLSSQFGYEPVLAKRWVQTDSHTFSFVIKDEIKWSDGKTILLSEIIDNLNRIKSSNSRHLRYLRLLKKIDQNLANNTITLVFSTEVDKEVIHELSLADAVILHKKNLEGDWNITSGPYFVKECDLEIEKFVLQKNKYSQLTSNDGIEFIKFIDLNNLSHLENGFRGVKFDLLYYPSPTFHPLLKALSHEESKIVYGEPTIIHYFLFNKRHALYANMAARKEFQFLVSRALHGFRWENIEHYSQLVPIGFTGRILDYNTVDELDIKVLRCKEIVISLDPAFKQYSSIVEDKLVKKFKEHGVGLSLEYRNDYSPKSDNQNLFASAKPFQGNQINPNSSFRFLLSSTDVNLEILDKSLVEVLFGHVKAGTSAELIHKKILDSAVIIPFARERPKILIANDLNYSDWNKFDMRMRLYQLRRKKSANIF